MDSLTILDLNLHMFFKCAIPASFSLFSSFHYSWQYTNFHYKFCRCLDSNPGHLELEAAAVSIVPPPAYVWYLGSLTWMGVWQLGEKLTRSACIQSYLHIGMIGQKHNLAFAA